MANYAFADVEDASVRVRWFGGRSAAEVAAEMPLLPPDAPGLPPPGPSFRRTAHRVGDAAPAAPAKGKKKKPPPEPAGAYLTALVRASIYQDFIPVDVERPAGVEGTSLVPGLFACGEAGGDPYGPQPCRLAVVGKCLGAREMAERKPFVGPGSDPLWEAWRASGMPMPGPEHPVFLTNLVRFAPDRAELARMPKGHVADGLHLLYQELIQCRPEVLLVLGADALKALFGNKAKVNDYRGRVAELRLDCRPSADAPEDVHVVRVVAADHPAAVARDPDMQPLLANALRLTARTLGYAPPTASVPLDYRAVYTLAELEAAVAESRAAADGGGYLAFDCEWDGRHPSDPGAYLYTVQWSHAPGHARVAYLRRCGGAPNPALPLEPAARLLRRLFVGGALSGARLVAHFGKADLPWLESVGVDLYPHFVGPADPPHADGDRVPFGWQLTTVQGSFDTYVALHCVDESAIPKKLEIACAQLLGCDRWDTKLHAWLDEHCKQRKIKKAKLTGYGEVPEDMILSYGGADVDHTGRLYRLLNGDPAGGRPGLLDKDRHGNSARQIFGVRMRAWAAWAEMERTGIELDLKEHHRLRDVIAAKRDGLIEELRAKAGWPGFNPASRTHRVDFLFGEEYLPPPKPVKGKAAKAAADSARPPGGLSLYLTPYKATDTFGGKLWAEAKWRAERDGTEPPAPAADKETLIHLAREHELAALLRDVDFLGTAMKILFRKPDEVLGGEDADDDPEGDVTGAAGLDDEIHEKGLVACLCGDGRIRSTFGFVETGRSSSSRPNMQNTGGAVDSQYDRILVWGEFAAEAAAKAYKLAHPAATDDEVKAAGKAHPDAAKHFVSRSIFKARNGWYVVGADLKGAEIAAAAWASGDPTLIEHAYRNTLPEDHPDWLDLHSDLARDAFGLKCTLAEVKKNYKPLRVAAKRVRFGHYYGASPDTILRQVLEETTKVTIDQIVAMVEAHDKKYPVLAEFFAACRARVHAPGWLCNGMGGLRRFRRAADRDLVAGQEREAQNWSCQGAVADVMNTALGHVWAELKLRRMRSRIILSVHDSVMLECPPEEVPVVVDEVLPLCVTQRAPFVPATLDGVPLARGPYHFGIDVEVCRSWGVDVPEAEWRAHAAAARAAA